MTDVMAELLATVLPGDGDWPAGDVVLGQVRRELEGAPDVAMAMGAVSGALPAGFARGDEAAVRAVEAALPGEFERVVGVAYLAYYTDPGVRGVIERVTGYAARPPQPLGYALAPFDEGVLAVQRRRAPFWRDPGDSVG